MMLLCEVHYEYIMGAEICMHALLLAVQWDLCTAVISGHFNTSIHRWLIGSFTKCALGSRVTCT